MSETCQPTRSVPLEGGVNFRDLGGYACVNGRVTRWQTLYRSGTTHLLTTADRERVAALGVATAFDLRSRAERAEFAHGLIDRSDVLYVAPDHDFVDGDLMRLLDRADVTADELRCAMTVMYRRLPYELASVYRELFASLIRGPVPLVFNCAAGKDRTGVAAALLLWSLDVKWPAIVEDYLLSQPAVSTRHDAIQSPRMAGRLSRVSPEAIDVLFGVEVAYLDAMREEIVRRNGTISGYLVEELGLAREQIHLLMSRFLE
jgi:protein-tyrosine phosphatase